jgi:fumarate reductase flavoprotein subunit
MWFREIAMICFLIFGGAGLAAALAATENGCKDIIVLEKAGTGGNSAMAHDLFGIESPVQIRMGTDARRDDFFKIAMRWSHWSRVNPRIVRAFIDKSGDTIRWLEEKGITFELGQYYINQSPHNMLDSESGQFTAKIV